MKATTEEWKQIEILNLNTETRHQGLHACNCMLDQLYGPAVNVSHLASLALCKRIKYSLDLMPWNLRLSFSSPRQSLNLIGPELAAKAFTFLLLILIVFAFCFGIVFSSLYFKYIMGDWANRESAKMTCCTQRYSRLVYMIVIDMAFNKLSWNNLNPNVIVLT